MAALHSGKILVVEDEDAVRRLVAQVLVDAGYEVIEAQGGIEGSAAILEHAEGEVPLAIVDLIMPDGNGLDFASRLQVDRPSTKILFISGLSESMAVESLRRVAPTAMLEKPFTARELLLRVRELLGEGAMDSGGTPRRL